MYKDYTLKGEFEEGQTVFAKISPNQPLIVRRYVDRIYYCKQKDYPLKKELVYFARELQSIPNL